MSSPQIFMESTSFFFEAEWPNYLFQFWWFLFGWRCEICSNFHQNSPFSSNSFCEYAPWFVLAFNLFGFALSRLAQLKATRFFLRKSHFEQSHSKEIIKSGRKSGKTISKVFCVKKYIIMHILLRYGISRRLLPVQRIEINTLKKNRLKNFRNKIF